MQEIKLDRPKEATSYPSPFIRPDKKDKGYHLQTAKAIYWTGWQTYNNPYGNMYRNTWLDNRNWARGNQGVGKFAGRPPAKNDHTKNPLLKQINFSAVNEMVKYCDIFVTMLEQSDLDIVATAINPAAAVRRNQVKADAAAYQALKPFYEQANAAAGEEIAPTNPIDIDFETQQELEVFFNIGFKLKEELLIELANQTVLNENDWKALRKMVAEDLRDTGYRMNSVTTDNNNKIRVEYIDPINSGWEDFRGHKLQQLSRFWTIKVKTGAQIVAETNGQLTPKELYAMATLSQGKYGNPMFNNANNAEMAYGYINSDSTYNLWFYDNWKFPVLESWWEDWDVYKYRRIKRVDDNITESFAPVDFNYQDKNNGNPYQDETEGGEVIQKVISTESSSLHNYRHCKWVIGTDVCYDWGLVTNCPRNPIDIRYALSPIKIYRSTGAPLTQRLKPIAEIMQDAWYKFQNEIARSRPSGVSINVRAIDNIATIEGRKINRYQVLELFNEQGTLLYSDRGGRDDMGNTISTEPIKPGVPADMYAMQRWIDVINECSYRMQMESGMNEFAVAATKNPEQSATAVKAGVASAIKSIQQYSDALNTMFEDICIDVAGKIKELIKHGKADSYISSIGDSLLKGAGTGEDVTLYTYGIQIVARPTAEQRAELKAEIRKAFGGLGTPEQGSPYLSDLLYLESMIDSGVNLKVCALFAAALHRKNMKEMQTNQQQNMQMQAQLNDQNMQATSQAKMAEYQQMKMIDLQYEQGLTVELNKREQAKSAYRTENQLVVGSEKSKNKTNELLVKETVGA